METEKLLNFGCEMGRQLLQNGAEIYRVEESILRLLAAYGRKEAEVFAIPSCIILNIQEGERNYTKSIRVQTVSQQSAPAQQSQRPVPGYLPGATAGGGVRPPDGGHSGPAGVSIAGGLFGLWAGGLLFYAFWGGDLLDCRGGLSLRIGGTGRFGVHAPAPRQ